MAYKRGQSAAGAAVLLAIIAALLIMFIVLIPPQQRAELLGEPSTGTSGTVSTGAIQNLLTTSPGRIDFLARKEIEHPLPVIRVSTQTESKILAEKNIAYAKRGVFSSDEDTFSFSVPDLANTERAFLNFKVKALKGKLIVLLNGEEVLNSEVLAGASVPVNLPKNSLKAENEIIFRVSSPGLAFWATNEVSLEDLKVVADVINLENQYSRNVFLVSDTELRNLEKATLRFQAGCLAEEAGRLTISINGKEIYNAVPDCDVAMVPIEFSPADVQMGENEITFNTERGTYLLSHASLISKLKEIDYPVYYFELSNEQYQAVKNNQRKVRLRLDFVDVQERKYGQVQINGHIDSFDTSNLFYVLDISDDIVRGANAIKIKPWRTLDVRELKVDLLGN